MRKRTKIVATLGPASDDKKTLCGMIKAGLDVARLNFSHGNEEDHRRRFAVLREAADACGKEIAVMGDLQGPKIRIKRFENGSVVLADGDAFFLDSAIGLEEGNQQGVGVALDSIHEDVGPGDILLLNDGLITLEVDSVDGTRIHTTVVAGGILSDHKGLNLKGGGLSAAALTDVDRENIKLAAELDMDLLAVSFVRSGEDVEEARRLFSEAGGNGLIVAKIERTEAVENIDSIIDAADVIMVARGDLGVEMGYAQLTGIQKSLINQTRAKNKIVITATQMMESMILNPIPTRAEVSDVANAVIDGTDAVMLSGETAVGKYPVEAVRMMATLAQRAESQLEEYGYLQKILPHETNVVTEAVSQAAVTMAKQLKAAAIFSLTSTGFTSRLVSKHRPDCPILAITGSKRVARWLSMNWGVLPILYQDERSDSEKIELGIERARQLGYLRSGDIIVATAGHGQQAGGTDQIRVIQLS